MLKNKEIKIITLTREPISRNVSGFFQNLEDFISKKKSEKKELIDMFFKKEDNYYTISWFDRELSSIFGIDIYKGKFCKDRGYQIIEKGNIKTFVTRIENLNRISKQLGEFLEIENFILENVNEGSDKWYSSMYNELKTEIEFPADYIEKRYISKYMKHFYTDEEINKFKNKWLRKEQ
ncbi:putative capsular polysaccharide synthesis family protein [uncultured Ilyobacter sp.]|uniref:putative capsular polysaccharide synthesis family protein n=1 Tax=uncultured Ilyobacter sp. TaxID=544433 RepID=UPI002D1E4430|nr:putative capsular polysaccharide synthesis family protein [uncultured Ilyobacter sp.]